MSIILDDIKSGYNLDKINVNFQRIEDELNNNKLSRNGLELGQANQMNNLLDMNGNSIINVETDINDDDSLLDVAGGKKLFLSRLEADTAAGLITFDAGIVSEADVLLKTNATITNDLFVGGDANIAGALIAGAGSKFNGTLTIDGDLFVNTINANEVITRWDVVDLRVGEALLPLNDSYSSIGSPLLRFKDAYIGDTIHIRTEGGADKLGEIIQDDKVADAIRIGKDFTPLNAGQDLGTQADPWSTTVTENLLSTVIVADDTSSKTVNLVSPDNLLSVGSSLGNNGDTELFGMFKKFLTNNFVRPFNNLLEFGSSTERWAAIWSQTINSISATLQGLTVNGNADINGSLESDSLSVVNGVTVGGNLDADSITIGGQPIQDIVQSDGLVYSRAKPFVTSASVMNVSIPPTSESIIIEINSDTQNSSYVGARLYTTGGSIVNWLVSGAEEKRRYIYSLPASASVRNYVVKTESGQSALYASIDVRKVI